MDAKALLKRADSVLTLYAHYSALELRALRAQMQGDRVRADRLDFRMDVQCKAKRALSHADFLQFIRLGSNYATFRLLPESVRLTLGEAWHALDDQGDYRELYYQEHVNKQHSEVADAKISDELTAEQVESLFSSAEPEPETVDYFGESVEQ